MAQSSNEKNEKIRADRKSMKQKRRELSLKEDEFEKVKKFVKDLRGGPSNSKKGNT